MNYNLRRKNLLSLVAEGTIILFSGQKVLKSADEAYPFEVNKNFYYLTGIDQEETYLILNNKKENLYVLPNDEKLARWVGYNLTIEEAQKISQCDNVFTNEKVLDELKTLAEKETIIYLDLTKSDFVGGIDQGERIKQLLLSFNDKLEIKDISSLILSLRAVKDEEEIKALRHSIHITKLALDAVMKKLSSFHSEKECQALFEERIASLGNARTSFSTIAAGGKNATTLHYSLNNQEFASQDMILMDLGACIGYYNADITRTFPHLGKYSDLQKSIYQIVLNCNKEIIKTIKPGVTIKELQEKTKTLLAQGLKEMKIISSDEELNEYYFHNISHHLGLDTHDPMDRTVPLQAGNVITVEPGLYLRNLGIGVRIEDDVLVTENGSENLSQEIIKEIDEIETFMKGSN